MKLETLRDLYVEQLHDLYSAETQLVEALPKMAKAASNKQLQTAFTDHLAQTKTHVTRLEQIFSQLGEKPEWHTAAIDAGLIAAAQQVEHYEIAGDGCVHAYAHQLGETNGAMLLQQTLDEEGAASLT